MPKDEKWFGDPHTLVVHSVYVVRGPLLEAEFNLDCEVVHPNSCSIEVRGEEPNTYEAWDCDVGWHLEQDNLASMLQYSGTPVTKPGTYQIQSWGRKYYAWNYGTYEYDGGIGVMYE